CHWLEPAPATVCGPAMVDGERSRPIAERSMSVPVDSGLEPVWELSPSSDGTSTWNGSLKSRSWAGAEGSSRSSDGRSTLGMALRGPPRETANSPASSESLPWRAVVVSSERSRSSLKSRAAMQVYGASARTRRDYDWDMRSAASSAG